MVHSHGRPSYIKSGVWMIDKYCNECKETKVVADYYPHPSTRDRLSTLCRVCTKEEQRLKYWTKKYNPDSEWLKPQPKFEDKYKIPYSSFKKYVTDVLGMKMSEVKDTDALVHQYMFVRVNKIRFKHKDTISDRYPDILYKNFTSWYRRNKTGGVKDLTLDQRDEAVNEYREVMQIVVEVKYESNGR